VRSSSVRPQYEICVDPDRLQRHEVAGRLAERVVRGQPALIHRGRGQRREPDDVADGEHVRHGGPVLLVDGDPPPFVRLQPGRRQVQLGRLPLAARRVHDGVGRDPLPGRQGRHRAVVGGLDRGDLLAEAERHREVAQVELERLDDLGIADVEHPGALVDDRHPGAERGEHGRVLDPDHPGPDDHHGVRDVLQLQDAVGVDDPPAVELDGGGPGGRRAGRDDDVVGGHGGRGVPRVAGHGDGVRVDEPGGPGQQVDVVADELRPDDLDLAADDVLGPREQVLHRDVALHPVAGAVHVPL
jgi:hypothetical protein